MAGPDNTDDGARESKPKKPELTGSTVGNLLWMFAGGGTEAVLKIVVLLFLARLLTPTEFGLVGAALTVVALAEVTGRIGVAPSIIQAKTLTRDHIATGLTVTIVVAFLIAGIVYFSAEAIARLYRIPELVPFVEAFAFLFIIKGFGLVSQALLQRELRFREFALINLTGYVTGSAIVSIVLAILGFGAWALVVGQLVQQFIVTLCLLYVARDSLVLGFRWSTFVSMLRFGFGVTLTQLGNFASQNADYFVIGRYLGPEALGYYTRAYLLLKQAATLVGKLGDKVLFPTLATIQEDHPRLQRALNRALSLVAMTQVPFTALLVVAAPEIVLVLMGPQWEPATLPFQILISALFFRTAYQFVGSILRAAGRVYVMAFWQWTFAFTVLAGAYLVHDYGLWAVSIAVSLAVVFCHFLGLFLVHKVIGVNSRASLVRLVAYTAMGGVMAALLIAAKFGLQSLGLGDLLVLLGLTALFFLLYAGLFFAVGRIFGEEGNVFKDQVLKRLRRKTQPIE